MVSFWPFKGEDNSAASFEKTLSQLSQKITKASTRNEGFRQQQRRYKVLWTLYSSFAYILIALILTLVTGWQTWGAAEYTAVAVGPLLIYGVRTVLDTYFNYRISNSQNHLNDLIKQREATIQRLKTATKYDSTQQLLDKYGGAPKKRQSSPQPPNKRKSAGGQSNQNTPQGGRTGFAPPPTANIPGRPSPAGPITPQGTPLAPVQPPPAPPESSMLSTNEDFAPNAFPSPRALQQPSTQYALEGPKWYDRILDVVLGEDETQARNRIALICKNCRLVNGQAPPGTRSLEEIGKWRCSSCHAWNGVESEEKKILKEISGKPASPSSAISPETPVGAAADTVVNDSIDNAEVDIEVIDSEEGDIDGNSAVGGANDSPPAGSTRSKARQRRAA